MATAQTNNTAEPQPNDSNPRQRKVLLLGLALLVVLGVVGVWGWYTLYGRWSESTSTRMAYVNGNVGKFTPSGHALCKGIGRIGGTGSHEGQVTDHFDPTTAAVEPGKSQANLAPRLAQCGGPVTS
ncbi:hypothetical protein [Pseudomonas gessardii]|uniref:hypothetical protein n=1 Tax=Pseudomonas gessardii TaxID=78544 RepID=UPI001FD31CFB|nr:hypothetical protein [Pseudomonas gessardii]